MKLKERLADLHKEMQKWNCCLKLETSSLHFSKDKLMSEKQLYEKSLTYANLISIEAHFQVFLVVYQLKNLTCCLIFFLHTLTPLFIQTVSVMGEKTLGSQQNCWIILQYIDIRYILVLYILYWTLEKALFIGSLLDGQYLQKLYSAD